MTLVAASGDTYIGEYTFDNLYLSGWARVSTEDNIHVLGVLELNNAYLKANAVKPAEGATLQFPNAVFEVAEPLFEGSVNVVLDGATLTVNNIGGMDNLQLLNSSILKGFALTPLEITADSITIDAGSSVDMSGRGYAGGYTLGNTTDGASLSGAGGSYGGRGGVYTGNSASDQVYGDYRNPNEFGSGSSYYGNTGAAGGGLVRIVANSMILDGTLQANGNTSQYGGGGSGGGIRLDVDTLSGMGSIEALGASGSGRGGGGGGRIAVYYTDKSGYSGSINAYGGTGYASGYLGYGGAGTVYLKSATQGYGNLICDNNGRNTAGYSTPLRAIGAGVSDSIVYSPTTGQSILTNASATWPIPDATTGALGLIGLEVNPNTIYTQTFTVVDNTATTITVNGDMSLVATAGDSYIGEYRFNGLSVVNGAQVSTDDNIYFDTLDTTGGVLNANNFYQAGMADPTMMLAQYFSTEMGISAADKAAQTKLARTIKGHSHLLAPPKVTLAGLKQKTTHINSGFSLHDMSARLMADINPLDNVDKQIKLAYADEMGASPLYYVKEKKAHSASAPRVPVLLAQAEWTVATDAVVTQSIDTGKKGVPGTDPLYSYDLSGNRITMTDPTGTTYYEYDALNRLTRITNPKGEITSYTYDAVGHRTGMTYANGMTAGYSYDAAGKLLDLVYQSGATQVAGFSYAYDNVGNRTSMTDEYGIHNYTYDALYRLTQATHPQPTNPLEGFDYDPVGNRYPATNVYNAANQLLEDADYIYSYDRNGNTINKKSKADTSGVRYYWNAENQLTKIEEYTDISSNSTLTAMSKYIYDGLGRRVAKNINGAITKYVYDNEDIILETDEQDTVLARYTHGPGIDAPISIKRNGQSYYYIADGLGSIVKLTDAAGTVVNNYVYDSFGNIVNKTEAVANPYTYTGLEYDVESGLYYYRLRYYNAAIGRFLSEDPLMSDPNAYVYVGNNPINYIDPMGLKRCNQFIDNYMDRKTLACEIRCWDTLNLGFGRYILSTALILGGIAETGIGLHVYRKMFGDIVLQTTYVENIQIFMFNLSKWTNKILIPTAIFAPLSSAFDFLGFHGANILGFSETVFFNYFTIGASSWISGTLIGCSVSCLTDPNSW